MVDPITIISTVGALANIIDLMSKTIKSIRDLPGRWKQADLEFLSLAAQLTALRAALDKIQQWSDNGLSTNLSWILMFRSPVVECLLESLMNSSSSLISQPMATLILRIKLNLYLGLGSLKMCRRWLSD
ncbi:hypothetical protein GQ44DRAFT_797039, partial [Phaeosphaeriaceae sp. PMI808]